MDLDVDQVQGDDQFGRRTNLGGYQQTFVGRRQELAALHAAFDEGAILVSLIGAPGVGKTRLAREFGRRAFESNIFDQIWFCSLTDAQTPLQFITAIATAMQVPQLADELDEVIESLDHQFTRRGRVLLIWDSIEKLVNQVRPLIDVLVRTHKTARVLVTSRQPLNLPLEIRYTISPMEQSDALDLYETRALEVRADLEMVPHDRDDMATLVERLDRLPLAIELAAARSAVLSPSQMLNHLDERFKLLRRVHGDAPPRHFTLRGALDWSWDMLEPWERDALKWCSVFRGGFTIKAAEAVIDLSARATKPWAVDVLSALFDRSLIYTYRDDARPREVRYGLFDSIRDYADEKLDDAERDQAQQRHSSYFLEAAKAWDQKLDSPDELKAMSHFKSEWANCLAVVDRFRVSDPHVTGRMVMALDMFVNIRGPFDEVLRLHEVAATALRTIDDPNLLAQVLGARAFRLGVRGRADEAMLDLEQCELLIEPSHDPLTHHLYWLALAHCQMTFRQFDDAQATAEKSLEVATRESERDFEGLSLIIMGWIKLAEGEATACSDCYVSAREIFERALKIFSTTGSARYQAITLSRIGNSYAHTDNRVEQQYYYEAALSHAQSIHYRLMEGACISALGRLALEQMRFDEAERLLDEGLEIQREVGRRNREAVVLAHIALLRAEQGDWDESVRRLLQAVDVASSLPDDNLHNQVNAWFGLVHLGAGQYGEARKRFVQAQIHAQQAGDSSRTGLAMTAEAAATALLGDCDKAVELAAKANECDAPTHIHYGECLSSQFRAIVDLAHSESEEVLEHARSLVDQIVADPTIAMPETRILAKVLEQLVVERSPDTPASASDETAPTNHLVVGPDVSWIQPPGLERVDLSRRRVLRRFVQHLVAHRLDSPGSAISVDDIIEFVWPDETFVGDSAQNRVYAAIAALREIGLAEILHTRAGGYLLDPNIAVEAL